MLEFEPESFRLIRQPKWNKKERRHLGISKDDVKIVQIARGNVYLNGKLKYIVKTAEITESSFDPTTGYMTFHTINRKSYRVRYREPASVAF